MRSGTTRISFLSLSKESSQFTDRVGSRFKLATNGGIQLEAMDKICPDFSGWDSNLRKRCMN
jgi:hypothetical protein